MDRIAIAGIVLACHLALISWIDYRRYIIPNALNVSLALSGFLVSTIVLQKTAMTTLIESGFTIFTFLLIGKIYSATRKRRGFGAGDIKFLGAAALWVGLLGIPWVVLIASIAGLLFVIVVNLVGRTIGPESRLAFGPHLSLGLMLTWLLRDMIHV